MNIRYISSIYFSQIVRQNFFWAVFFVIVIFLNFFFCFFGNMRKAICYLIIVVIIDFHELAFINKQPMIGVIPKNFINKIYGFMNIC
ncbi:hypothetical protein [Moraxella lacunata]|uniref:hypothetical protein n=1 Tax=Moraxella lacunata TaxID=477 RepID=UPI003EE1D583